MMYSSTGDASNHRSATAATPTNLAIPYPFRRHNPVTTPLPFTPSGDCGGADDDDFPRRDERFPQWSNQETRDLIEIWAQLEWGFITAKRNNNLWEMVANRMREKGYRRTPQQCKCKWKNLVTSYKEEETYKVVNVRQCPFFNELHSVFTARANRTQQAQVEAETGIVIERKRLRNVSEDQSHEKFTEQEQEDKQETEVDQAGKGRAIPKPKASKEKRQKTGEKENSSNNSIVNAVGEMMRNFIAQQQRIDMQWKECMEKRAEEREAFEREWREKMEKLERERVMMEKVWGEREEEWRLREERRGERRDALLTMLLNKLIGDESC